MKNHLPPMSHEQRILRSWESNVDAWVQAVREGEIASRVSVTDAAVFSAVLSALNDCRSASVLDVGCGEGWLSNRLAQEGMDVLGIDAVAELIGVAAADSALARFQVCAYEDVGPDVIDGTYDLAVCNFSLLGGDTVATLLRRLPSVLKDNARLLIQTLHPHNFPQLAEGWQVGSWEGFNPQFIDPPPWYFRPLSAWHKLLEESDWSILDERAPRLPGTDTPASLLLLAQRTT